MKILPKLRSFISREKQVGSTYGLRHSENPFCLITYKIVRLEEKCTGRKMYVHMSRLWGGNHFRMLL
jgi:hypothetical protein